MKSMRIETAKSSDGSSDGADLRVVRALDLCTRLGFYARAVTARLPMRRRARAALASALLLALFGLVALNNRSSSDVFSNLPRPTSAVLPGAAVLTIPAIGDWGRQGRYGQELVAPTLASWARAVSAPFIVSVGDNMYTDGVGSELDVNFNTSFLDVYVEEGVGVPWYLILGNHDYRGSYLQVGWPHDPLGRWTLPHPFYSVVWDYAGREVAGPRSRKPWPTPGSLDPSSCVAAVYIDTCPLIPSYRGGKYPVLYPTFTSNLNAAVPPGTQYAWMEGAIANASATCDALLVFGHHPVYSPGEHGDNGELIARLKPLLDRYGVDAYIAGHDHTLAHAVKQAAAASAGGGAGGTRGSAAAGPAEYVQYTVTGGGSEVRDTSRATPETTFLADSSGFTLHSMNGSHIAHTYVHHTGVLLYQMTVPLRAKPGRQRKAGA